jgi:hypothetical protein
LLNFNATGVALVGEFSAAGMQLNGPGISTITWPGSFRPDPGSRIIIPVFLPEDPKDPLDPASTVESILLSLTVDIFMADLPRRNILPGHSVRIRKMVVDTTPQDSLEKAYELINSKQDVGDPILGVIGPKLNDGCKAVSGILSALIVQAFPMISYGCTDLSFSDKSKHPVRFPALACPCLCRLLSISVRKASSVVVAALHKDDRLQRATCSIKHRDVQVFPMDEVRTSRRASLHLCRSMCVCCVENG